MRQATHTNQEARPKTGSFYVSSLARFGRHFSCSSIVQSWRFLGWIFAIAKVPPPSCSRNRSRAARTIYFGAPYILCQLLQLFCKNYSCMNLRQLDGAGWVCQPQAPGGGLTRVWPSGLRCGNVGGDPTSAVPDRSEIGPYHRACSCK